MDFWRWLDGTVTAELTSADMQGAMAKMRAKGLQIRDLERIDQLTLRFTLRRRDYGCLRQLCEKRGDILSMLSKKGLYWSLTGLKRRPVLVLGLALLLALSLWVPGRVFFVQVEGNATVPARKIVETAASCGISFGVSRRSVRSEKMKNALLEAMPNLSWAGVNTYGCTAIITVRERTASDPEPELPQVSSIIASRDGIIRQFTVLRGSGLCTLGQEVKAGDVLISGFTDCGLCIRAEAARGEIFAETNRNLEAVCPAEYGARGAVTGQTKKISLIIGKKRINFANSSGNQGTLCAKMYEENYISLPGGFVLPVAVAVETCTFYEEAIPEVVDGSELLSDFARRYLPQQMCAGSILQAEESITGLDGLWYLSGSYTCNEMIGITRIEENYVENN